MSEETVYKIYCCVRAGMEVKFDALDLVSEADCAAAALAGSEHLLEASGNRGLVHLRSKSELLAHVRSLVGVPPAPETARARRLPPEELEVIMAEAGQEFAAQTVVELPPKEGGYALGCAHGRLVGQPCPHCLGFGASQNERDPEAESFAAAQTPPSTPTGSPE